MGNNSIHITLPIKSKTTEGNKTAKTPVLLDTGAGGIFMNKSYAKKHNIEVYKLDTPIIPCNVDRTLNQAGKIMHYTWIWMKFQDITILVQLLITNIGSQDIIFGLPWFEDYDPQINWSTGKITIQKKAKTGWLKCSQDNWAWLEEIKGKETVTIQWVPETTKITEEVSVEELPKTTDMDNIKKHQWLQWTSKEPWKHQKRN